MACPKCGSGLAYASNIDKLKCMNPECTYTCAPVKRVPPAWELEKIIEQKDEYIAELEAEIVELKRYNRWRDGFEA